MQALAVQKVNGWSRFVSMQNHLNLIYREEEREMMPLCMDQGIGVIPWSPLARGRLARGVGETTTRIETDRFGKFLYRRTEEADSRVVEAVGSVAQARGVARATVALAWLLQNPAVSSPIIGATKPEHISDAVAAVDLSLTAEEVSQLEAPYIPHAVAGFA